MSMGQGTQSNGEYGPGDSEEGHPSLDAGRLDAKKVRRLVETQVDTECLGTGPHS
jgi:hypothetical protein